MVISQGSHVRRQIAPQFKQAGSTPGAGVGSELTFCDRQKVTFLPEIFFSANQRNGLDFYTPDRILILVRETLTEDAIIQPIASLMVGNVLQVLNYK